MAKTIEILVPTAEARIKQVAVNARVHDLNEKVVGFLWNEKPNGDFLLRRLIELLSKRYKLARTMWGQVEGLHIQAEVAREIKQMADEADAVIIAVGD